MTTNNPACRSVSDLPDYYALKKLASVLWQQDNAYQGAAIMIGAGFSRAAATTGDISKRLPLWVDLSSALAKDLNSSGNSDPLRLAEEYHAYFGKQALHDLIKREVNDTAWAPGNLHKDLLKLPWKEVLTTNWDTLLERASTEIFEATYNVVCKQEDIASTKSPRIIKLHGTINKTEDLIFTQEDYRKYPQQYAAFVNLVRQVFIENELCLLGFSGDDPNFLQWTGWVRDQLATNARRIYLVGALNLTAAKRKYLESIDILPIDLGELVSEYDNHDKKHAKATEIFLEALIDLKPRQAWEWRPTHLHRSTTTAEEFVRTSKDQSYAAALLEQQIPTLIADRNSYPGWLICPAAILWELQTQISNPHPTPQNVSQLKPDDHAKLMYEVFWRHDVTHDVIPPGLIQELLKVCNPSKPCALSKRQQLEISLFIYKNARLLEYPELKEAAKQAEIILEENKKYWPESADEVLLHKAAIARDELDYNTIENIVEKVSEKYPMWKIRKASLLAELGRFDEGEKLIADAYQELLIQHRNDRNSIYILSRLAWAHWLLRGAQTWKNTKTHKSLPFDHQELKCNPWSFMEYIQERISKAIEKQQKDQEIEPLFEPGRYKDNSNTIRFDSEIHPILLFEGMSASTGTPMRWHHTGFLVEPASRLARLADVDARHRFSLAIRAANSDTSDTLKTNFSRIQMARISQDDADRLLKTCVNAIKYWKTKISTETQTRNIYALERLRVFIEVLARVVVRATAEDAKQIFMLAMELGKDGALRHFWLLDSFSHLIEYTLESIPKSMHDDLLVDALLFPLPTEIGIAKRLNWPNPVIECVNKIIQSTTLDRRIDEIIDCVKPNNPASSHALVRLMPLIKSGILNASEQQKLARKIWGDTPAYDFLPDTGLLKYTLLELPSLDKPSVKARFRKYLFEADGSSMFGHGLLLDISNAAQAENLKELPNEVEATNYFKKLVMWRAKHIDRESIEFLNQNEDRTGQLIGRALSQSVVLSLPSNELNEENFDKLLSFYSEANVSEAIIAFVYFANANALLITRVANAIRSGLQSQEPNRVAFSAYALLKWRQLDNTEAVANLIARLIYLIESGRTVGLPALLWVANQLLNANLLSEQDIESIKYSIPIIFECADYNHIPPLSREAISASLIRAACVRLARDVLTKMDDKNEELTRLMEAARLDALPEVRYAEFSDA